MLENIKKTEFLQFLVELGSHSLYYPETFVRGLAECGLDASISRDGQGLELEGQTIPLSMPEWGEPGISAMSVLAVIFETATGEQPQSKMTGRGFQLRDVMNKLATYWGLEANYL